ncbi:MAG: alpha/beta fold hydrolase [Gemmatimonadetes bacterium]|nr:alpha/beta fold hydrolase [Gemmatimonadota bacterium]
MLAALLLALVLFWPALVPRLTFMARELPPEHRSPTAWRYVGDEVHFRSSDNVALHGWFLHRSTPEGEPCGTVLFLSGNAGNVTWQAGFTPHLTRYGLDVLLFDYRGYGASEGTPSEEGLHRDALGAYSYLREARQLPSERILLVGHSLGTAVAVRLASQADVAGLVLAAPFTSFPGALKARLPWFPVGLLPWKTERFDALASIQRLSVPTLMAAAREDRLIPMADARTLFDAAPDPKVWVAVAGGHNDIFRGEELHRVLPAFLQNTLGCPKPLPEARTPSL